MFRVLLFIVFAFSSLSLFSQITVSGKVIDNDNKPVMGAAVSIDDTYMATLTDKDGYFKINNLNEGTKILVISGPDFKEFKKEIKLISNLDIGKIKIFYKTSELSDAEIFSDISEDDKNTNLSVTLTPKTDNLHDNYNDLNQISSVFLSTRGGGYGDARMSIRGYSEENIGTSYDGKSIFNELRKIKTGNGIQLNDPEDNSFNWAMWLPLTDLSRNIIVEKGMGSSLLNYDVTGGSVRFLTDCHKENSSIFGKVEYASGNNLKYSFGAHSGLLKNKFSISTYISYQNGNGIVDKTWNNVNTYYLGAYYKFNKNHNLEFFGFNSTQRHGQHLNMSNIAAYDYDLAEKLKEGDVTLSTGLQSDSGILFNSDWNNINSLYSGQQLSAGKLFDRKSVDWINSNESYSQMPVLDLLWNASWTKRIRQHTSAYLISGTELNSAPYGDFEYDNTNSNLYMLDFNKALDSNIGQSDAILKNKVNDKVIYGAISKFNFLWSRNFHSTAGVEYRGSKIDHYNEVRDLLGGSSFMNNSDFDQHYKSVTNKFGAFLNSDFANDELAFNVMFGWSIHDYSFENLLKVGVDSFSKNNNYFLKSDWYNAFQSKLGAKYTINENMGAFGNFGFVYSAPLYSQVFDVDNSGLAESKVNPYYFNYELGFKYNTADSKLKSAISFYSSSANNEVNTVSFINADSLNDVFFIPGIDIVRRGIDISASYLPFAKVGLYLNANFSDFKYQTDASGSFDYYINDEKYTSDYSYILINLKKGISPQVKINIGVEYQPVKGLITTFAAQYNGYQYAAWSIFDRTSEELDENEKLIQPWRIKPYTILNFGVNYSLPLKTKFGIDIFGNVNNILNSHYIIDAVDNSSYGIYSTNSSGEITNSHSALSSAVFMGLPLNFRAGVKLKL